MLVSIKPRFRTILHFGRCKLSSCCFDYLRNAGPGGWQRKGEHCTRGGGGGGKLFNCKILPNVDYLIFFALSSLLSLSFCSLAALFFFTYSTIGLPPYVQMSSLALCAARKFDSQLQNLKKYRKKKKTNANSPIAFAKTFQTSPLPFFRRLLAPHASA